MKDGAVEGVRTREGKTFPARAVVSNASAITTFNEMLPRNAVPADYLQKLSTYKPSISSFIVWLGLNEELRGKIHGSGIHVASGMGPKADYESCMRGGVDQGSFSVSIYDNIFPGYSAPGTSTLMLLFLCGYDPWRKYEKAYQSGEKNAYHREKERWTDILIKRAEKAVIPNLFDMIEVRESATPLTNWRYTRNSGRGHLRFPTVHGQFIHESHREQDSGQGPLPGRCMGQSRRRVRRGFKERAVQPLRKSWKTGGNLQPL